MKKISVFLFVTAVLIIVLALMRFDSDIPIWEENVLKLSSSFDSIDGDVPQVCDLSDFTTFEWDKMYSFQPYFAKESIYEIIGYRWDDISETVSEGMNQIVFLNNGEVVCYLYGYPDAYNLYFDLGYSKDGYVMLNYKDNTKFILTQEKDIKYLELIKE